MTFILARKSEKPEPLRAEVRKAGSTNSRMPGHVSWNRAAPEAWLIGEHKMAELRLEMWYIARGRAAHGSKGSDRDVRA